MASAAGGGSRHEVCPLHKPTDEALENIDLGSGGGIPRRGARHANLASTALNVAITYFTRFDVEVAIALLIIIFSCTVAAIFTRDAGWFMLDAPFTDTTSKVAFIAVGLQTFTVSIDNLASTSGREVTIKAVEISSLSPEAHRLGAFLYVCLLFSLLLAVGMLWYIALFYSYMKGTEIRSDKECAVRLLGALGILVAVLLFSVGTCAYSTVVTGDFARSLSSVKSLSSLNTAAFHVQTDYAYELTVAAWFFWTLAGTLFLVRRLWAHRKPVHDLTDLDDISVG